MAGNFDITLIGGSPWGFRIRGGSESSQPVRVSRINGGGKAGKYGIREGDIIEAVNGHCLVGLSQIEVQQLIRDSGDSLTLKLRRDNELLSCPRQTSNNFPVVLPSRGKKESSEIMSEEKNNDNNKNKDNDDVSVEQISEGVSHHPINITLSTSRNAPVGPTFKAQATKAIWSPDTFSKEEEHLSEGLSNSEKSENISYFIQNGSSIDQINLCDGNRRNGNNVNNMEKKAENIQFVTEKSIPLDIDPYTITYCSVLNSKQINKEDTVNEKIASIDDDIQQDTYYAIPYDRIITTKTIMKAPTYEGIGPTENGLPIGLRTAVKKEHSSEWYKTMFKSLHKCDDDQDLKVQTDGYMSDSELNRKDKSSNINVRNKMTHSNRLKEESSNETNKSPHFFPSAKSSLQTYNHKPWIISDYEPGFSSITNNENLYTNARFLPPLISPKPKYVYNDGYDSDSTLVRKTGKSHTLDLQEQKRLYKKIQKGGEIPLPGLCKPAAQKPQDPIVGPPPPMPANWDADHYYRIYTSQTENFPSSSVYNPVEVDKTLEKNKQILQDDFRSKLDEVLLNQQGVNIRQSSATSPNRFSSVLLQHDISDSSNKVVILYDFIAQTSRELSLKKGDVVNIQRIVDKNWYEGNIDGKTGIFPISYAESISSKSLQRVSKKCINGWARAKYNFTAKNQVELTLNKDDIVSLIREVDNNWYEGSLNGKSGIFPISYVEVISDPDCYVPKTSQLSSPSSSILSLAKNERNELDINKNNIKNVETTKIEKVIPIGESFSPKKNITVCEYNNNKVSPYQALYAYKPQNDDELELKEGDVVYVIEKCDDGWFVGTSMRTGLFGTFPGNYIEKI